MSSIHHRIDLGALWRLKIRCISIYAKVDMADGRRSASVESFPGYTRCFKVLARLNRCWTYGLCLTERLSGSAARMTASGVWKLEASETAEGAPNGYLDI